MRMKPKGRTSAAAPEAVAEFRLEDFLPYRLCVAAGHVARMFAQRCAMEFGLTIPEWRVLATVGRFGTITPTAVGQSTAMDKVKVSRAAAALVHAGCCARCTIRRTAAPGCCA